MGNQVPHKVTKMKLKITAVLAASCLVLTASFGTQAEE